MAQQHALFPLSVAEAARQLVAQRPVAARAFAITEEETIKRAQKPGTLKRLQIVSADVHELPQGVKLKVIKQYLLQTRSALRALLGIVPQARPDPVPDAQPAPQSTQRQASHRRNGFSNDVGNDQHGAVQVQLGGHGGSVPVSNNSNQPINFLARPSANIG